MLFDVVEIEMKKGGQRGRAFSVRSHAVARWKRETNSRDSRMIVRGARMRSPDALLR